MPVGIGPWTCLPTLCHAMTIDLEKKKSPSKLTNLRPTIPARTIYAERREGADPCHDKEFHRGHDGIRRRNRPLGPYTPYTPYSVIPGRDTCCQSVPLVAGRYLLWDSHTGRRRPRNPPAVGVNQVHFPAGSPSRSLPSLFPACTLCPLHEFRLRSVVVIGETAALGISNSGCRAYPCAHQFRRLAKWIGAVPNL